MQNQPHVIAYFHSSLLGFSLHNVHMGFYAFIQCPPHNISGLPKKNERPAIRFVKFKILWNIRIQRGRRGARRVFRIMGFLHTGTIQPPGTRAGFSGSRASLRDFTSAAIRRDSQYAFYGRHTVLCCPREVLAVCRISRVCRGRVRQYAECVGWAIRGTHHLNGCLGATRVAYTKNSSAFANFQFQN